MTNTLFSLRVATATLLMLQQFDRYLAFLMIEERRYRNSMNQKRILSDSPFFVYRATTRHGRCGAY